MERKRRIDDEREKEGERGRRGYMERKQRSA
jgi:hypothetical protein